MANTFKLKTKANVGTATSDVYVVPSATTTVVIGVTLANTTGSSINVGVGVTRASSDDVATFETIIPGHLSAMRDGSLNPKNFDTDATSSGLPWE